MSTTKYQDPGERRRIVRRVISELPDRISRKICSLYMDGYSDAEIRQRLALSGAEFDGRKKEIRQRMLDTGIKVCSNE